MRRLLPLLLALPGCAGIERPSDLAPGPHLMLAGLTQSGTGPRDPLVSDPYEDAESMDDVVYEEEDQGSQYTQGSAPERSPERASQYEAPQAAPRADSGPGGFPVGARLRALEGKKQIDGRPADDAGLVRAAFAGIPGIAPVEDLISLRDRTTPRRSGGFKEGDIIFFGSDAREVPAVAVVHKRLGRGTVEAAAVTRGAVRFIRITPMYPHARRRKGQLANSFLRTVQASDPKGTAYLAGQLLEDVRIMVR